MSETIQELVGRVDIVELISQSTPIDHEKGRFFRGVDHDSLVIDSESGKWFWHSRDQWGDAYDWLTKIVGMAHGASMDYLRGGPAPLAPGQRIRNQPRAKARNMVMDALDYHQRLMHAKELMVMLQDRRGLRLSTVLRQRLGWHPKFKGWSIPYMADAEVCTGIKIRCLQGKLRYVAVAGSRFGLYIPSAPPSVGKGMVFLVEGEFKALSMLQLGGMAVATTAQGFSKDRANDFLSRFGQRVMFLIRDNDMRGLRLVLAVRRYIPHIMLLAPPPEYKAVDDWINATPGLRLDHIINEGAQYL